MSTDISKLIKLATEAVEGVPDHLQGVAFGKAFDALLAEQQDAGPTAPRRSRRKTPSKGDPKSTSQSTGEYNRSLLDQLDRTAHPEITHDGTALTNSLRVLKAARDELSIDGLSATDIAHVLADNFRCKIDRTNVTRGLNAAGQLVSRRKEGRAVIFRIMSRGEKHLDDLDAGVETESKPTKKRKTNAKKTKATKKKAAETKSSNKGATKKTAASKKSPGASAAVTALYEADFFSQPRGIGAIIEHLKHNSGRTYKSNEMSPALLRHLRSGNLTRSKNADNQYEYENA